MHPAPIRPSTLNVQTFEDSESHVYTHVWCTHERAIRRSEKVSPYFCSHWHSRRFLFKAALYGFPSSMLQMPKPFANPQTYQEIQHKASRGKKPSFKTEQQTYSNPILLSKVAQTPARHRRRNLERVRGWEAAGAKQLQRKTLRNHEVRACSPHRRRRESLAGASSGAGLHCGRNTQPDPRAPPLPSALRLCHDQAVRSHQHGDHCPRKPKSSTNQSTSGQGTRSSSQRTIVNIAGVETRYRTRETTGEHSHQRNTGQKRAS